MFEHRDSGYDSGMTVAPDSRHPLLAGARALEEALELAGEGNPVYLSSADKADVLRTLARAAERTQGLLLRVLATADDVALDVGARSPAAWLAHQLQTDYGPAARLGRLADALDQRWIALGEALVEGRVTVTQTEVISRALEALPRDLDPAVLAKAELHLIAEAAHHSPSQLRRLGRKVLEVVAPDTYDDHERRLLEAEEARARRRAHLTMRTNGDGTTDLRIRVPDATAERLKTYLDAFTSPRQTPGTTPLGHDDAPRTPYPVALGQAFCALVERIPAKSLPEHGGSATTVVVTISLDELRSGLGVAQLDSGGVITAREARRLACSAGLVPMVLGGPSEPLDLGRTARLYSTPQRLALGRRYPTCAAEGCSIPSAWCEAHHADWWSRGGRTDLRDGVLLCSHHHHLAHDPRYEIRRLSSGRLVFHRRP